MNMQLALYTSETSNWYALLNKAQAETKCYFQPNVENYLVYILTCMSNQEIPASKDFSNDRCEFTNEKREQRYLKVRKVGEQCLVVAGLFPDHANHTGIPLLYMMEKGRNAYQELANAIPNEFVYSYLANHFVQVIDVLHKVSGLCGDNHSIDLIQACELWQEMGSRHGWSVIQNNIGAFPTATASELQH